MSTHDIRSRVIGLQDRPLGGTVLRTYRTKADIDDILPNEMQPRLGPKEDEELQRQIKDNEGIFEPLLVEPHPHIEGKFRIIDVSSAGAGALGSIALLGLTTLTAGQVVGTDMFFGLAMSTIGGGIQLHAGNFAPDLLWKLVAAGIPGAIVGANMASRLPSRPLRYALSVWIIGLGAQLCYRGLAS